MQYDNFWPTILFLGLGTFLIRCSFIYLSSKLHINDRMKEILSFIPAAIFPALVTPMVFFHQGQSQIFMHKERLVAILLATFISYKSKNILITIVSGLAILFVLTLV
jgi:branched-subunit amino acid transport protein